VRWVALVAAVLVALARPAPGSQEVGEPVFWRLRSGLRVLAQELPAAGLVAVAVLVGASPRVEEPSQAGISILTREVMLQGTTRRGGQDLAEALDSLGASLQALTGPDHTEWTVLVPSEHVDQALELLAEVLTSPRFAPEDLEAQRRVSLVRLRQQRDQPPNRAAELAQSVLYPHHPYRNPLLGTPETVARLTREDLVRYHATFYTAPNTVVSVAGELPAPVAVAKVQRAFSGLRTSDLPARVKLLDSVEGALAHRPTRRRDVRETQQTAGAWVAVAYLGVSVRHPDWPALRVAATVLGGGMASRLFQAVREREGLAYAVGAGFPAQRGPAAVTLTRGRGPGHRGPRPGRHAAGSGGPAGAAPAPEEVARARRRAAGLHLLDHEDLRRRAFYPAWYELVGAGYRFDRQVTELVSRVTPADVQRVARRYLEHPAVAVVGPVLP
jgi:zinc protease